MKCLGNQDEGTQGRLTRISPSLASADAITDGKRKCLPSDAMWPCLPK